MNPHAMPFDIQGSVEVGEGDKAGAANKEAKQSAPAMSQPQNDADELAALRAANAALTQRLREIEEETPEERNARKLKSKNAELKQLKLSVERVNAQAEATKKKFVEQQAHLRELNAQIAKLQPPVPYKTRDRRRKKGKNRAIKKEQKPEGDEA